MENTNARREYVRFHFIHGSGNPEGRCRCEGVFDEPDLTSKFNYCSIGESEFCNSEKLNQFANQINLLPFSTNAILQRSVFILKRTIADKSKRIVILFLICLICPLLSIDVDRPDCLFVLSHHRK